MDSSTQAAESHHQYPQPPISAWSSRSPPDVATATRTTPVASPGDSSTSNTSSPPAIVTTTAPAPPIPSVPLPAVDGSADVAAAPSSNLGGPQLSSPIDLIPYSYWLPHQSNVYYAQLLHYNKLVSPSRGGGLQAAPLPPVVSSSSAQAGPRSRSSSKVSLKDNTSAKVQSAGGHGNRTGQSSDKNRSAMTHRDPPSSKMTPKQTQSQPHAAEPSKNRPAAASASSSQKQTQGTPQSSSVPTTPHQRARQFSLGSREPSPSEATNNHSPRSAYSENSNPLPSLRPLPPPRQGGCKYETSQINSRRRMPYSLGSGKLDKPASLASLKGTLTDEEEAKVASDMREIYEKLLPSDKVEEKRKLLVRKLEKILNDEWPGHDIKAHLFGSSGNLLCSDDSDVDICISTNWHELEGVCMMADLLARRGMEKVVCISAAKVPIVKIWDPELGLACDINVNNTLALENTRMIRVYVEIDPRVRQLMMIIKYWTRRRVINDAAFGGTLSSYTWICLIVAFLQLRTPPVLPALHQMSFKTQKPGGASSTFADNLKKLRGYGSKNKTSEANLLLQFFRFYAYEFDYDKYALSVRLGNMIPKSDKSWHVNANNNNSLCVEEPFNTSRNLGNTADDFSFRGLHMELRRAFDLICEAKFHEACEQYVFPKEEERLFVRPSNQPRPALIRSASQSTSASGRSGRGGRGGRHANRGGGSTRRSSSSVPAHDTMFPPTVNTQQDLAWYPATPYPMQYSPELLAQLASYHQHQESYRQMQMYGPSAVFNQQQGLAGQMAGPSPNATPAQGQSTGRSRTNSVETHQPPLSAPIRPDWFTLYGMTLASPMFVQQAGYGAYTTPNSTVNLGQDYRRPLQRSPTTTDKGTSAASGTLRSQSQPAARSTSAAQSSVPGQQLPTSQSFAGASNAGYTNINGVPIPNFISDDADFDDTAKGVSMPLQPDDQLSGLFSPGDGQDSSSRASHQPGGVAAGISFGDLANSKSPSTSERRRLSTDQIPQTILDRRMRRTSRSPSPLGHTRTFSNGNNASNLGPGLGVTANSQARNHTRPVVVNGSSLRPNASVVPRPPGTSDEDVRTANRHLSVDNSQDSKMSHLDSNLPGPVQSPQTMPLPVQRPSLAVGPGSSSAATSSQPNTDEACFRDRVAKLASHEFLRPDASTSDDEKPHPMVSMSSQDSAIAQMDLAAPHESIRRPVESDLSPLSPVYENAGSPTAPRGNVPKPLQPNLNQESQAAAWSGAVKQNLAMAGDQVGSGRPQEALRKPKNSRPPAQAPKTNGIKDNGNARGGKNEHEGGWQKAGKGKKKTTPSTAQGHAEPPPKYTSERKGG